MVVRRSSARRNGRPASTTIGMTEPGAAEDSSDCAAASAWVPNMVPNASDKTEKLVTMRVWSLDGPRPANPSPAGPRRISVATVLLRLTRFRHLRPRRAREGALPGIGVFLEVEVTTGGSLR
jgi:hypothetical protein